MTTKYTFGMLGILEDTSLKTKQQKLKMRKFF